MAYRIVSWVTGNVGAYAVRAVLNHPELELVVNIVSSAKKSGTDVGQLVAPKEPSGILATDDIEAALDLPKITGRSLYRPKD